MRKTHLENIRKNVSEEIVEQLFRTFYETMVTRSIKSPPFMLDDQAIRDAENKLRLGLKRQLEAYDSASKIIDELVPDGD